MPAIIVLVEALVAQLTKSQNKALFEQAGAEVIGAIINKVEADKIDMVRKYASKAPAKESLFWDVFLWRRP